MDPINDMDSLTKIKKILLSHQYVPAHSIPGDINMSLFAQ